MSADLGPFPFEPAAHPAARTPARAGFWRRYVAYSLDWLLLSPLLLLLTTTPLRAAWAATVQLGQALRDGVTAHLSAADGLQSTAALTASISQDSALKAQLAAASASLSTSLTQAALLAAACAALYFIGFEASAWRATPGKRWLGLSVTNQLGQRLDPGRATLRFFAGSLSWLTLNIGHAMAAWRQDGRALHDLVAGSRVIADGPAPRWMGPLLALQVLLLLAGTIWAILRMFAFAQVLVGTLGV